MAKDGMLRSGDKDNGSRRHKGGGPRPDNNAHKQAEAKERLEAWVKLTPAQQVEALDRRLGKGQGAANQRAKIAASMGRAKNKPAPAPDAKAPTTEKIKAKDRRAQQRAERPTK